MNRKQAINMTKEQAEVLLVQLVNGTRLTKAEYDALITAIQVLKSKDPVS